MGSPLHPRKTFSSHQHHGPFFFFFFNQQNHVTYGILVPLLRIKPVTPVVEAQSPKHWTAREVPGLLVHFPSERTQLFLHSKPESRNPAWLGHLGHEHTLKLASTSSRLCVLVGISSSRPMLETWNGITFPSINIWLWRYPNEEMKILYQLDPGNLPEPVILVGGGTD